MMNSAAVERVINPRRLALLLRRDLAHGYRGLLTAGAAVGGAMLLLALLTMLGGPPAPGAFYASFYTSFLFLGGCIYSSGMFREVHKAGRGAFYLVLPATGLEKFLSKLLLSSVGFAAASLLLIGLVSAMSELVCRALFKTGHGFFNPVAPENLKAAGVYLLAQSAFFLGSVWFRKSAFFKTVLAAGIILMGITIIAAIILGATLRAEARDILPDVSGMLGGRPRGMGFPKEYPRLFEHGVAVFGWIFRIASWAAAPVCWVTAYLRLREAEA
jgi:hypothetical protein